MSRGAFRVGTCQHHSYGMSCDEFKNLEDRAAGSCEMCGTNDRKLVIDHDHAAGRSAVRGLLCQQCNLSLGRMEAGSRIFSDAAAKYLEAAWHLSYSDRPTLDVERAVSVRSFSIPDDLWFEAQEAARKVERPLSNIVVDELRRFVDDVVWRDRALAAEAELRAIEEELAALSSAPPQSR